jgi:isopenicillin-N N-acyltransferase like protein
MPQHLLALKTRLYWLIAIVILSCGQAALSAQPSKFSPSKFESAELRFVEGIPVVTVEGTPEEIGTRLGTLLKQPIAELLARHDAFAKGFGFSKPIEMLMKTGRLMLPQFPESHRRELESLVKASGVDLDLLVFGNVMYELSRFPACSTLTVERERSTTGGPIFGRNLDFPTFGFLDRYSMLVVYRPQGKHAFASIAFPGFFGVASGMNDAGLCVAQLEVGKTSEAGPRINFAGTPVALCFRRIMEECTTVDEAEKLLREQKRFIMCNLAVCDRNQAAVFEITPQTVSRRNADAGICVCTNHFRNDGLSVSKECYRFDKLCQARDQSKLSLADVGQYMHSVNLGKRTIQTMIFEPDSLRAHLSLGPAPASGQPLKQFDLAEMFRAPEATAVNSSK